jgi:hypothetical protein
MNKSFLIFALFLIIQGGITGCYYNNDTGNIDPDNPDSETDSGTFSDTATDTITDKDTIDDSDIDTSSADTEISTESDKHGYYFIAGDWSGYGSSSIGVVNGGIISDITESFISGEGQVCVEGILAINYGSIGALGMTVFQEQGSGTIKMWRPDTHYSGIYVDVNKNIDTNIRFEFAASDGTIYCADNVAAGGATLQWSDFTKACWNEGGLVYNPSLGFDKIQIYAPGDEAKEVKFNYCLNELYPIKTNP